MIAKELVVRGHVQGVFFRAHVRDAAGAAGAVGYAENRADGSVVVHAQGDERAVAAVVAACKEGSPRSRVDQVDVSDTEPSPMTGFAIA